MGPEQAGVYFDLTEDHTGNGALGLIVCSGPGVKWSVSQAQVMATGTSLCWAPRSVSGYSQGGHAKSPHVPSSSYLKVPPAESGP